MDKKPVVPLRYSRPNEPGFDPDDYKTEDNMRDNLLLEEQGVSDKAHSPNLVLCYEPYIYIYIYIYIYVIITLISILI
jgi:hypothetical protein